VVAEVAPGILGISRYRRCRVAYICQLSFFGNVSVGESYEGFITSMPSLATRTRLQHPGLRGRGSLSHASKLDASGLRRGQVRPCTHPLVRVHRWLWIWRHRHQHSQLHRQAQVDRVSKAPRFLRSQGRLPGAAMLETVVEGYDAAASQPPPTFNTYQRCRSTLAAAVTIRNHTL
jgi:hypothetical protein